MRPFRTARLAPDDRRWVDAALDEAFAPLRARTTTVSPARVRAAVRWNRSEPAPLRGFGLLARVGELSTAAVISALVLGSTLASLSAVDPSDDVSRDAARVDGWILNGRAALQRPIDSRATDYRTTAGELAANAVTMRRASSRSDSAAGPLSQNQ